ncbi:putative kinetochore protein NDC80 [Astathelohania contejeani]|uniref:Kinetochore protein NDC80 n=1 Tax=Astathelohania contejeani TaxID=164912 RepID=A0ABQ7HWS8_9MICR|nr:putative kinetochore protein NDC80 [Thelohania contejeani]
MRRSTINPTAQSASASQRQRASINPRSSLAPPRDQKQIRDKAYQLTCIDTIYNFLINNGYEGPLTTKTLHNTSVKDFQNIFRFIYSFIEEEYEYGARFEEDVIGILRIIRYPYCSEINRSQLVATTPHTWPVILGMLAWLVGLAEISKMDEFVEDEQLFGLDGLFYKYVVRAYEKFNDGLPDDLEQDLDEQVGSMYGEAFKEIDQKREYLKQLDNEINRINNEMVNLKDYDTKKDEINEDMKRLAQSDIQLEEKKKKYMAIISKYENEISAMEVELEELRKEQANLKKEISEQTINPEDVKVMNAKKIELFKELEKIKPEKEELIKIITKLDAENHEKIEEAEKILSDIKNMITDLKEESSSNLKSESIPIRIIKEKNSYFKENYRIAGDISNYVRQLDEELNRLKEKLSTLEDQKATSDEKANENKLTLNELMENLKYVNNKLYNTGKLYLEKKEVSDIEQRKSKREMEKLENDLLNLKLQSNNSLLLSEQALQKAKIALDKTLYQIAYEKKEINNIIFNFYNSVTNLSKSIQIQVKELCKFLD